MNVELDEDENNVNFSETSTVLLADDLNVCQYTTTVEEIAEEIELKTPSWQDECDKFAVATVNNDSHTEGGQSNNVFLTLVEEPTSENFIDGSQDEVVVERIYEMEDMFLVDSDLMGFEQKEESTTIDLISDGCTSSKSSDVLEVSNEVIVDQNVVKDLKVINGFTYHVIAYHCFDCGQNFTNDSIFKTHLEEHLVQLQNSCAVCNTQFDSKSQLHNHIKGHFSKKNSQCNKCTKECTKSSHKSQKSAAVKTDLVKVESVPVIKCKSCNMSFVSKVELKEHSMIHSSAKPHICTECGATFTQNGSLQVHLRGHRGEKPYSCNLCGNRFTRAHSLKVHMRSHTGEKSHVCGYCGAAFVTSSHLTVHKRTHTGERPYSCKDCMATFITTSHLNVHRRVHAGMCGSNYDVPRTCSQCRTTFSNYGELRRHRRAKHKNNSNFPATCRLCKKNFSTQQQLNRHVSQGCS